ncbi:MAG: bifunctional hydroxymethylpyrimidine kinase/phosphomethylpyrimidine kinase [Verrucomicrobiota bacterium]
MSSLPVVLTIAGSDNSAGAGIQADLKTMCALGVYGVTALTCVVAEVPGKVMAIQAVTPEIVREQIRLLFKAFPIAAIKTGMLYSLEIVQAVCAGIELGRVTQEVPAGLVVDPVMIATAGTRLLKEEALAVYRERLFPAATLVTPNLDETAVLLGRAVTNREEMVLAGQELVSEYRAAFLVKGGHLTGEVAADLLVSADGEMEWLEAPFVRGVSSHGTGCTYSAAIAAGLGKGLSLRGAVREAKVYLSRALSGFVRWERADGITDALNHFAD